MPDCADDNLSLDYGSDPDLASQFNGAGPSPTFADIEKKGKNQGVNIP
jgi:hypothetical protein